jgi:transcriptional regulator with AAA-type ATPase domain
MIAPMTDSRTLTEHDLPWDRARAANERAHSQLTIAWSMEEPHRVGQSAVITERSVLGRGAAQANERRVIFHARRPGEARPCPSLSAARLSREQLVLTPTRDGLTIESIGKCPMLVNGEETTRVDADDGAVITLRNALVLYVSRLGADVPSRAKPQAFAFGDPDPFGIVGESENAWSLRDDLAIAARSPQHVLIHGPSGAGKELAARAIHGLSSRAGKPFLARSAATFPTGLVDAELFGNLKNYPNAGSPERPGLIGEADGATLFLDEIGELPEELQAHLLRVLDRDGEYQRLGESRTRKADLRIVAATNRPLDSLKHDLLARFSSRIEVPPLTDRREDIPLLIRHLLARFSLEAPDVSARFFERRGDALHAQIDPRLVEGLLRHEYTHHLRELERLLWLAVSTSSDDFVALTPQVASELRFEQRTNEPTADAIKSALAELSVSDAARKLGLPSRYALYRLMKKHGIARSGE